MATNEEQFPKNTTESVTVSVLPLQEPQQQHNFLRSGSPTRFMYFTSDGSWKDLSNDVLESLKQAFVGRKPMALVTSCEGGEGEPKRYLFDLKRMLQIDLASGSQRSIAWIDETGKCFFPRKFVSEVFEDVDRDSAFQESASNAKIDVATKIDAAPIGHQIKRKREMADREEPEVSSSLKVEDGAKRQRLVPRWANARLMSENEKHYERIRKMFLGGMRKVDPGVVITGIHECTLEGDLNRARQEIFRKQIGVVRKVRGVVNLACAWYGASKSDVQQVLLRGFGMHGQVLGEDSYGVGVHLSRLDFPQLSAKLADVDDNGEKHFVLCRAILGNMEKVEAGSKQWRPSTDDFDAGSDDPKNPNWFVIWYPKVTMHLIPECVVSFKSAHPVKGQVSKERCPKYYSFEKLFSKMRNSLPLTKARELLNLYGAYKVRQVTKDYFLKKLRGLVGDELLLSTIREICTLG